MVNNLGRLFLGCVFTSCLVYFSYILLSRQQKLPEVSSLNTERLGNISNEYYPPSTIKSQPFSNSVYANGTEPVCLRSFTSDVEFLKSVDKFYIKTKPPEYLKCYFKTPVHAYLGADDKLYFYAEKNGTEANYRCQIRQVFRLTDNSEKYGPAMDVETFPFNTWPSGRTDLFRLDCYDKKELTKSPVYSDCFTHIETPSPRHKTARNGQWNVLILAVDSLSQINAKYRLPKTLAKLQQLGAVSQKWYNKVGENTYPNTFAMTTGLSVIDLNMSTYDKPFDDFPFIWKDFGNLGYKTFYVEDSQPVITTFNYQKKGFINQPTDHYGRTLFKVIHKLGSWMKSNMLKCLHGRMPHSVLWSYTKQFIKAYHKIHPFFAFSFANEISHDFLSTVALIDDDFVQLLEWLDGEGIFNDTFVIIWSDHGQRTDVVRKLPILGSFESQTPFSSIIVPWDFRKSYENLYQNLKTNSDRLSTSYDLYHTLRHIQCLSNIDSNGKDCQYNQSACVVEYALGIPCSTSLLAAEFPYNRSCHLAHIPEYYCSCYEIELLDFKNGTKLEMVPTIVAYLVDSINEIVKVELKNSRTKLQKGKRCSVVRLSKMLSVKSVKKGDDVLTAMIFQFETSPKSVAFEAYVQMEANGQQLFQVMGGINRIDKYASTSTCVTGPNIKPYCICENES